MYSGGGGSASQLHLLELDGAPAAPALGGEVLVVPWEASLMIRACFSEEDMKDRLEACHDEYDFGATLAVASMGGGAFPKIGRAQSELQSLMRISYAVFCLKKKKTRTTKNR